MFTIPFILPFLQVACGDPDFDERVTCLLMLYFFLLSVMEHEKKKFDPNAPMPHLTLEFFEMCSNLITALAR